MLFFALTTVSGFGLDIPSFKADVPLAPEDPSLMLAGIGGLGIGISYIRWKVRK